jgi:heme-degrading monooxygenase HmoA
MFFRLVSCTVDPGKVDETVAVFRSANAPGLAALPGFVQVLYGLNRKTGKVTTVTVWDSEEHERASRANIPNTIANMAGLLLAEEVHQETLEVVHSWPAVAPPG